ncbi:MAG: hypothetical protein HQL48_06230 [Gammaproteobacteria bacterium]|nr:hypothetical protein [Gammaproteobacteria bacterium]
MSEDKIADFNKNELWIIENTLEERYRRKMETQLADSELRLNPHSSTLTPCPTLFWSDGDANFVIVKIGDGRYRCQFFYRVHQQFGTGIDEYQDLAECMVSLLQVQADHHAKQSTAQMP